MTHDILQIIAIVGLLVLVMIQDRQIDTLEKILKMHDKSIQDLYIRKENRKPGFEMTLTSKEQCDAMIRNLEKLGRVKLLKK